MYATRFAVLLLTLAPLCLAAAGCRKKEKAALPSGIRIGFVLPEVGSEYSRGVLTGAREAAEEKGFELVVKDAAGKSSEQAQAVDELVRSGVHGLVVHAIDPAALRPALERAVAARMWVVAIEQPLEGVDASAGVEFDQEAAGRFAADYLGHRLKSAAPVAVLGTGSPGEKERLESFEAHLREKHGGIEVAGRTIDAPQDGARAAAAALLQAAPKPGAVFALSPEAALGAVEAVRTSMSPDAPFVISYRVTPEIMAELQKPGSPLAMVIAPIPQRIGRRGAVLAWRIATNQATPSHVYLPILPLTKDNYGSYPPPEDPVPADLPVPWPSSLPAPAERRES